jgi:hypothetical protein
VLGSNISGFGKLVHYLSVEHMAPKITLYGILFHVRVSSKMEKKRSNQHLILFALHHHIKTKMYAICASYGFACSHGLLNNKVVYV